VFKASFSGEVGKYCLCVMVEIRRCQSLRVTSLGTSPRPDGLGIIVGFGSRITLLGSKNSCETTTPFISLLMSLLLVHVSRDPLCTYPSTLCVYHAPNFIFYYLYPNPWGITMPITKFSRTASTSPPSLRALPTSQCPALERVDSSSRSAPIVI
jgi:hypothetical protein